MKYNLSSEELATKIVDCKLPYGATIRVSMEKLGSQPWTFAGATSYEAKCHALLANWFPALITYEVEGCRDRFRYRNNL